MQILSRIRRLNEVQKSILRLIYSKNDKLLTKYYYDTPIIEILDIIQDTTSVDEAISKLKDNINQQFIPGSLAYKQTKDEYDYRK